MGVKRNCNKVLDFVSLDNYQTNSHSFQLPWSLDQYKTIDRCIDIIQNGIGIDYLYKMHCHQNDKNYVKMLTGNQHGMP